MEQEKRVEFIYVDDQVKGIYMSKDYNGEI